MKPTLPEDLTAAILAEWGRRGSVVLKVYACGIEGDVMLWMKALPRYESVAPIDPVRIPEGDTGGLRTPDMDKIRAAWAERTPGIRGCFGMEYVPPGPIWEACLDGVLRCNPLGSPLGPSTPYRIEDASLGERCRHPLSCVVRPFSAHAGLGWRPQVTAAGYFDDEIV
jgi:hypothetical protein